LMPRKSLEGRSVVSSRKASGGGHAPPRDMTPPAKALWRRIILSKPYDWFDPGSLVLLAQYCELAVQSDLLVARRRELDLPSPDENLPISVDSALAEALERRISSHVMMLTNLATKLRLSVQSAVRRDDGRLDEKRPGAHRLLGGNVTRLGPRGA
jgi:hypothetical protein